MKRLLVILLFIPTIATADVKEKTLAGSSSRGAENYNDSDESVARSPKKGWGDFKVTEEEVPADDNPWRTAALWIPNRVLDFIDIFRVDLGVGPAVGGVVRLTKYGQAGIRTIAPASLRVGAFGRDWPAMIEHSNEFGIGPAYVKSKDREVCDAEFGLGLDIFLVGGYAGVCLDEFADFVGGVFTADPKKDDLR